MAFYTILYSFWTILCVSHELSFHSPWASYGKRAVNVRSPVSDLFVSYGLAVGKYLVNLPFGKSCDMYELANSWKLAELINCSAR